MDLSAVLTYVPFIGDANLINVIDNDTGLPHKFLVSQDVNYKPFFIPKNAKGDEGNALNGAGTVSSYTDKDPVGRIGNMITHLDLIAEGTNSNTEYLDIFALVRIPAGLPGLLGPQYSLSNQPPAESFDYSQWLPRTEADGCLSFYGGTQAGTSGLVPGAGRFPTTPTLPPFTSGEACPLLYLPPGFYGSINTIMNSILSRSLVAPNGYNITIDDDAQYGALLVAVSFDAQISPAPGATVVDGTGKVTVDFSHSGTN